LRFGRGFLNCTLIPSFIYLHIRFKESTDIDNDDVPNDRDVCDFTPASLRDDVIKESGHPLRGTVVYDVDGDCDVDQDDVDKVTVIANANGPGECADGDFSKREICTCPGTEDPVTPPGAE